MASFNTTANNIGYLTVSHDELARYSHTHDLVCDGCAVRLTPHNNITVIPLLNMAYCEKCATAKLSMIIDYAEDRQTRQHREKVWCHFYGLKPTANETIQEVKP